MASDRKTKKETKQSVMAFSVSDDDLSPLVGNHRFHDIENLLLLVAG
jgi:hypothetical protein